MMVARSVSIIVGWSVTGTDRVFPGAGILAMYGIPLAVVGRVMLVAGGIWKALERIAAAVEDSRRWRNLPTTARTASLRRVRVDGHSHPNPDRNDRQRWT